MVRNNRRKAFTIVELVIVIAVIAILAAVMIPTFTGIIKRANISADEQLAASINTQLSIYKAEGNKIETEADLINALRSDEDFTAQLNPKSAKHGYHYWYNAETQTVKLMANEDALETVQQQSLNAGGNGANVGFAHAAPRSIVPGLYFLDQVVNEEGNEISKFFAVLDGKEELGAEYLEALTDLTEVKGDNKNLADAIIARMKATVVISNSGVFYHAETTANAYYYFIPGTASVKATQYKFSGETITPVSGGNLPTPKNNQIVLPSSIALIEKNALKFATANSVTVVTSFATPKDLAEILAADCSNAIFTTLDGSAYVVNGNELHINGGAKVCDLAKRLPFSDFRIAIASDANPTLYTISGNDTDGYTLYVLITQFDGKVTLHAKDAAEGSAATSSEVNKWSVSEEDKDRVQVSSTGVLTFDPVAMQQSGDYTAIITANAINNQLDNETNKVSHDITVEVVKATDASIKIGGKNYILADGKNHQLTLTYDGTTTYDVTLNGATYSTENDVGIGTNSIAIVPGDDSIVSVANNILSLTPGKSDNTFTVSIDGCLETTFYVNLIDASLAEFTHTFKKSSTEVRPFYVGTANPIKLSSLFKFKGANEDFAGAKITIYDRVENGNFYSVNEIKNTENNLDATYPSVIETLDAWNDATIQFSFANRQGEQRPATNNVYIEITGSNNYSIIVTVQLVEGATNVAGEDFEDLGSVSTDVVLNGDATITSDNTKINLGANTLYGNGYKINATSYKSNNTSNIGDYFISVNGGTIDNVYINGPVYPTFDYKTNTGWHVSGIKSEGASTVQHSYVAGFRQPIALNNGTLNVTNTTLYGGNYANLQVNGGSLNLTDVTTVQPENGIANTFGALNAKNETKYVIGLGIVVEYEAVDDSNNKSVISINGYLDQYNWISYNTTADLPVFKTGSYYNAWYDQGPDAELDFRKVLAALFNGIYINVAGIKSTYKELNFINDYYYEKDGMDYLNAGIIFISLGVDGSPANANKYVNTDNNLTVSDKRNDGSKTLEGQALPLFSGYPVLSSDRITIHASAAMRLLEDMEIKDNVEIAEGVFKDDVLAGDVGLTAGLKIVAYKALDVSIKVWSYKPTAEGTDAVAVGASYEDLIGSDPENNISGYYNYYVNYGK